MVADWMGLGVQVLVLLLTFSTLMWRFGQAQEKRLIQHIDTKFEAEIKNRHVTEAHVGAMLEDAKRDNERYQHGLSGLQREVLELKAELPERYVRREDYIRGQTVNRSEEHTYELPSLMRISYAV